jgi:hypothetical protein
VIRQPASARKGGRQKAEGGRQKAEGSRQKAAGGRHIANRSYYFDT